MTSFLPFPKDINMYIEHLKYKKETESFSAFLDDFVVREIRCDIEEVEQGKYNDPIVRYKYIFHVTYKHTNMSFETIFKSIYRIDDTIKPTKHFILEYIQHTIRNYHDGDWKRKQDYSGVWYYSSVFRMGDVPEKTFQHWKKQALDLQRIMGKDRFELFVKAT